MKNFILSLLFIPVQIYGQVSDDPFLWLEEIDSPKSMAWVKEQDSAAVKSLEKFPQYKEIYERNLQIYNSKERIAVPSMAGKYIYNLWQDSINERGLWRRTTLDDYLNSSPHWETVLDLDSLSKADSVMWVYKGADFLYPGFNVCLLNLSRGGADATVIKEFDLNSKKFITDGFRLPEAKSFLNWIDSNTVFAGTNFGEGSMTSSGYPRTAKTWKRGTPLSSAETLFEGKNNDVYVYPFTINTPSRKYEFIKRAVTFFTAEYYAVINDKLIKLDFPEDVQFDGIFQNQLLLELKSDWNAGGIKYSQGSLITIDYDKFLSGSRKFISVDRPGERESIVSVNNTKNYLVVDRLNNVKGELYRYKLRDSIWVSNKINAPEFGNIQVVSTEDFSDKFFFTFANFLSPTSLYICNEDGSISKIKSLPEFFDAGRFEVKQYEAVSKDGTQIPYFIVHEKDIKYDGSNPTLQYAYGGFEISELPYYSATVGTAWLSRGGVYVLANIRGGGEFGPKWHLTAIKENRHKAYEDMIAVSEDLIKRKITSPQHLGIMGGSNGGLLVGVMLTQQPDLYNAVVCQSPLLDMKRYNKLLAGASWMGEYGNPDSSEDWSYIKEYSPYQNLKKDKKYPLTFFTTSTRDDRVHPGHARKMAAKMESLGIPVYFYEYTEGGHSSGVTNKEVAFENALVFSYLWMRLK
ncbi:MAG TPA: prolyl oligopeptidase family serine peptidase [Ignavibacteriaceae bacterium]|nr:prolyl oligopeptidase family serine peptidase [Ignavibacteriaceae bacterium]